MKKTVFIVVIALLFIFIGSVKADFYRPPNPVMNYVPQYIGIYDTHYANFVTNDCRGCHGGRNTVAIRHQYTSSAFTDCPDGCLLAPPDCLTACHSNPADPGAITYNCIVCHVDGGPLGDLGYHHHRSDLAESGLCTTCHQPNLLVDTRSVKTPSYHPSALTYVPIPFNCENCHWPSGNTPHTPPPDWPKPIEATAFVATGTLYPTKPYTPQDGTHHMTFADKVSTQCHLCHANEPGDPTWDPTDPLLIRYCENCHSKDSLHGIEAHITAGHGLTAQQKCVACHGGLPNASPLLGPIKPVMIFMSPSFGPEGTLCYLHGDNFGSSGNILLTPRMGETDQPHIISSGECSWTNEVIVFTLPYELPNRNYNVKVETPDGLSNMQVFTLTGTQPCIACPTLAPSIDSIEPTLGTENSVVTIHGQNFGDRHTADRDVLLIDSSTPTPITVPAQIISWTESEIKFRVTAWTVVLGTISVKVQTENGESNQVDFQLGTYPHIEALDQPDIATLRLSGSNFNVSQQYVGPDRYGWFSTVALSHPDQTISINPDSIISWSDTEIQLTLPENLHDVYGVTVETKYFYDSDGNSTFTPGVDMVYHTVASDPQEFSLQRVVCNLVPDLSSVPRGGTLVLQATVTNNTDAVQVFKFATRITKPSGGKYPATGYLKGPVAVNLGPNGSISKYFSQYIPNTAPLGTYIYHGYVGVIGNIYDECQFQFIVTQ